MPVMIRFVIAMKSQITRIEVSKLCVSELVLELLHEIGIDFFSEYVSRYVVEFDGDIGVVRGVGTGELVDRSDVNADRPSFVFG